MAGLGRILWRRAGAANDLILTPSSIANNVHPAIGQTAQSYSLVGFARYAGFGPRNEHPTVWITGRSFLVSGGTRN
jgi:hypothetical protein